MDNEFFAVYGIGYVIAFLAQLIVLVASILLLVRIRNLGSFLLFVGSLSQGVISVAGLASNVLAAKSGPEALIKVQQYTYIGGQLSYLIFGIGLLLVVLDYIRRSKLITAGT